MLKFVLLLRYISKKKGKSKSTDLLWNFNCQVPLFAFEVISLVCITETNNIDILLSELFHLPLFRIQSAVVICLNVKMASFLAEKKSCLFFSLSQGFILSGSYCVNLYGGLHMDVQPRQLYV